MLLTILSFTPLHAEPPEINSMVTEMGAIAYINASDGRDAIFVKDAMGENVIFTCASEAVIILTPSVSADGKFITFVVDNGRNQKTIHILGPIQKVKNEWEAHDLEVMTVRGGAWPVFKDDQSVYMSMPEQASLSSDGTSNIYVINSEEIKQLSDNQAVSTHIWPLLHPNGNALIYRYIPQTDEMGESAEPVKSVLFDLESGNTTMHFVNQFVYLEQWAGMGEILFSFRDKDVDGNRVYALYSPETREIREIYRNKSRQGALSSESRFLATIRSVPEGGSQFDIFVTDLISNAEINLTQTPRQSESLIGWIR
ncbi:MAG: hypothetical protein HN995_04190 [Candidatus Marinimicrobia bacterium]|jgi:Tol biopolymer transport system component|nr:hypothetical protein [Candidatus Neomarinimicrobiota bacterium]MBT3574501.1 hypothetical protein [Candidatus Neomarinimicrobiota bacterium]MBT3679800.1 hypothetical protein [Candidatus Neomarinimicrobiota bacterium]MBT3950097.1 hypothetical protein [Candidatus Neomarinimicrobiota bacterium]MBT4253969.1 hypothetical protein [Candidatus Neomarinimicrobiota bacterium]